MSKSLLIQYIVLGLIVAISVLVLFRKLAPQLSSRWLAAVSIRLSRSDSRFVKALGHRVQPKQGTGDCGDGCSTCGSCGPKKPVVAPEDTQPMPLRFRQRSR